MKKPIILVFLLLSFSWKFLVAINTQDRIDSIKREILATTNDSILLAQYLDIGKLYQTLNFDSALTNLKKSTELAKKTNDIHGFAISYFWQAFVYFKKEDFDNSLKYYLKALDASIQVNDSVYISTIYSNIGILYSFGYDKQQSIDYYIKSLKINTLLKRTSGIAANLNNIGLIYQELHNYEKAIEYFNQTLVIDKQLKRVEDITSSYANIGDVYLDQGLYQQAFEYLIESYQRIDSISDPDLKIQILSTLGEYYLEINQPDSAIKFIKKSLNLAQNENRKRTLFYNYFLVGKYFLSLKNYKLSIMHFTEAIKNLESLEIKDKIEDFYEYLSIAYSATKDYKNAHKYLQKSYAVRDSLQADGLIRSLGEFEKQKEFAKIQAEFQLDQIKKESKLENEAIQLKWQFYVAIIIIAFLIILGIILITTYRNKVKANKQLQKQNEIIEKQSEKLKNTIQQLQENEKELEQLNMTKDKFFSIVAHDLKNPFNILLGYSELLLNEPSLTTQPQKMDKIIKSIHSTAGHSYSLLENLLAWSRAQSGGLTVDFQKFNLAELINSNIDYYKEMASYKGIDIFFMVEKYLDVYADKNMLNMVLRNLVDNAVKFSVKKDHIDIIAKIVDDKIVLSVSDSGLGISSEDQKKLFRIDSNFKTKGTANENGTGLGLLLCKEFVLKNNGEIFVKSELGKGSVFSVLLPIA